MQFRKDDGNFDFSKMEIWMSMNSVPAIGVIEVDGDSVYFNSYGDTSDDEPLFLYSYVDEDVIRDMRNGRVDVLTGFSHPSALIFKEIENSDGSIEAKEVSYYNLPPENLPEPGAFLN